MGMLSYAATISLDGYVANSNADLQWAAPNDEVFAYHLQRMSHVTTEILGRRAYSLMQHWSTVSEGNGHSAAEVEFAQRWGAIEKVVVSSTLSKDHCTVSRTRLIRELTLNDIRQIVAENAGMTRIFGPTTAAEALRAGLVDRLELFIVPVVIGKGRSALPDGAYRKLKLSQQCVFGDGTVFLQYERR